jgi:hypothetical protein
MKNNINLAIMLLCILIPRAVHAQSAKAVAAGVYLTDTDYINHKLSYATNCQSVKHPLRLHDFFYDADGLTVINDGKKRNFKKDEVYGFADCSGQSFRFYKNSAFRIADTGAIFIYVQEEYISRYKTNNQTVYHYYFSKTAGSEIISLTGDKLIAAYRDNDNFIALLALYFQTGSLLQYDEQHKMYKLSYLLLQSYQ